MSKKNKKKKINKLIKEVERKREVGFNSLINENHLINDITNCFDVSTENVLGSFIDQWKNKNIRILISTFFKEYMNEEYGISFMRWMYDKSDNFKFVILIELINTKNKDEKISFYIRLGKSDEEYKKKGKYIFKLSCNKTYRDPKTKSLMENETEACTFVNELE